MPETVPPEYDPKRPNIFTNLFDMAKKAGSLIIEGLLMMGNPEEGYDYRHRGDPPDSRSL